jgi:hypothetical protein
MPISHPEFSLEESTQQRPAHDAVEGLSNDYLNHFSEVLMLVELASMDAAVMEDLAEWRPIDYPSYFATSQLRRAPEARAAYFQLCEPRRAAFEQLVRAMDKLAMTAIRALRPPCEPEDAALVADVTTPALRSLIAQASAFLNSGGIDLPDSSEVEEAQSVIDRLLEHVGEG